MRSLYGLLGLTLVAVVAFWIVGSDASRYQVDPGPIEPPSGVYDPIRAGEDTPDGFRQLLPRDAIFPVYNPTFTTAAAAE